MTDDPRLQALLDQLLVSHATPDEVCESCPELLPEVRDRWRRLRRVQADLDALFPPPTEPGAPPLTAEEPVLPRIPGYEAETVLGRGGMGIVFRARHLRLNRLVALKMVLAGPYAGPQERARFQREAEAVAALRHPNIVQIYDIGDSDGRPYFTMEYVEGGSLARKLAGAPQPARQAAALLSALAAAMEAAHQSGIVHRDLKPANILLTADAAPKISDFGLARRLDGESGLTRTGAALGTPSYMAPEQAQGNPDAVGPAADIYALGAILYELLTGRPPFQAKTATETVQQLLSQDPVPPSRLNARVPRDLETICLKCLHKEPQRRYAAAAALAEDLDRFLRGEAIAARPESRVARLARRVRRRPVLSALVVLVALFTFALVAGGLWVLSARAAARHRLEAEQADRERATEEHLRDMVRRLNESSWLEARAALERARDRLGDHDAPELRRRLDQGERDLALALRLDNIRLNGSVTVSGTQARCDKQYEDALREAGFGQVSDPPELVAGRIRNSHIRRALVTALDDWAELTPDPGRQDWILEVARQAEPNPTEWRVRARTPAIRKDPAALAELIANAPIDDSSVSLLLALAKHLNPDGPERERFLKQIQRAHPDDFWANLRLGDVLMKLKRAWEAIGYYQAALAVRPQAAIARNNLGVALAATDQREEALEQHWQAVLIDPTTGNFQYNLGFILWKLNRPEEAVAPLRRAAALDPQSTETHLALRTVLLQLGQAEEMRLAWGTALEANPPQHDAWYGYAELCLFLGHEEEYRRARRSLLARFGTTTDPYIAERTSRTCLLLPASEDELRQAVALAEYAAGVDPSKYQGVHAHFLFVRGLADYRQGNFDRAIATMRGPAARVLGPAPRLVLALALHRSGKTTEARRTLAGAVLSRDWRPIHLRNQDDWIYHILRREAESLILPNLPAFLEGKYQPVDNDERFALLGICQFRNRTGAAARLYVDAFDAAPRLTDDPGFGFRYNAARAAALAGCGRGEDSAHFSQEERSHWRKKARVWLELDLAAWANRLDRGATADRDLVRQWLTTWRADPDFAELREPGALQRLSVEERQEWLALWNKVDAVLKRTTGP
jgi:serine/threonine-protein kinase